jgi:ABC-type oligopeptide transport system ATPase subunit
LDQQPLVRVENLEKSYRRNGTRHSGGAILALDGVSLSLDSQTTTALVGESGSGKSTLAACLTCLEKPTAGRIWFGNRELTVMAESQLRDVRPQIQLVFQDPASSLNHRWSAQEIVTEPLRIKQIVDRREQRERARSLFQRVGLPVEKLDHRPDQFSGGQRQRLALARALALQPKLLVLDEVLSALDCSVQAQIVNLLLELQASAGLTYLFITHDLAMAAHLSDQIAVLHQGRIVEIGQTEALIQSPQHPVTQRLLSISRESHEFPRVTVMA